MIRKLIRNNSKLFTLGCCVYNLRNIFRIHLREGQLCASRALLNKVSIDIRGENNTVIVEDLCRLKNCTIMISGNHNTIRIGRHSNLTDTEFFIEDDGNEIIIGAHTAICGKTHLAAIEGTKIQIGSDCLFSSNIHFQTGDAHSILDMEGRRVNWSADIVIGDHVWVGTKVTCLKGTQVAEHSIIGACALVSGQFEQPNCILAGVPAKIVRRNINWSDRRVPVGELAPEFMND